MSLRNDEISTCDLLIVLLLYLTGEFVCFVGKAHYTSQLALLGLMMDPGT